MLIIFVEKPQLLGLIMMSRSLLRFLPVLLVSLSPVIGQVEIARSVEASPQKDTAVEINTVERIILLEREGAVSRSAVMDQIIRLAQSNNNSTVVSFLIGLLKNDDPSIRSSAASGLGAMGKSAKSAIPQLISLLNDPDRFARCNSAQTLGWIGEPAKVALRPLIRLLKDDDRLVRDCAAFALVKIESFLKDGENFPVKQ
jgi:hypothetical protein